MNECYCGDVRDGIKSFIARGMRAQCVVTSPPYWGLRSYIPDGHERKLYELGLEPTPAEYVANMVDVFALVRDLLADDGTLWLNLGDSYSRMQPDNVPQSKNPNVAPPSMRERIVELAPKNLVGIPWRVAFALQADGWYLRSDIIWHKPNPMPESVTDRPTKAHEYLFLLAKNERYFYDAAAIAEPSVGREKFGNWVQGQPCPDRQDNARQDMTPTTERNRRSVWTVATQPYSEAHFATFPPALIEPCILAGSRVGDVVFDPFLGSGTTAQVAQDLGRQWLGCELNPAYLGLQAKRTAQTAMAL